jgi:GrpB-like predicted nucleotidyltransferase (UPF0157 family)
MNNYVFKPYNDIFPALFEKEKLRLLKFFNKDYRIDHVGSTAIPNLGGKGVIDICIVVPDEERLIVWDALTNAGYELRPNYRPDMNVSHTIVHPDPIDGQRKYQIHIRDPLSEDLIKLILFRDYLRSHPEDVIEYSRVKETAAREANNDKTKILRI